MSKDIKDYLHYYLGCQVRIFPLESDEYIDTIEGIVVGESVNFKKTGDYYFDDVNEFKIALLLRPLSDMKEDDVREWGDVNLEITPYGVELDSIDEFGEFTSIYPDGSILSRSKDDGDIRPINGGGLFILLLKRGFDLFGLIESGLAIDKTSMTNEQKAG